MVLAISILSGTLIGIILIVLVKGGGALSLDMLFKTPASGFYMGGGGGIANAIVGSFFLAIGGTALAFAISVGVAVYLQHDYTSSRLAELIRMVLDILWGIPSIIYGVVCFVIMTEMGFGTSLLAGIIALAMLEVPIMTRAMDESLRTVPNELREAAYSLGLTRFEVAFKVIRKQALPGILSGILLAFGRGIGDAASIFFTTGFSDYIPTSPSDSSAALPTLIFFLSTSPNPAVRERAFAAAFILLVIVLITSIVSRFLSKRYTKFVIK